MSVASTTKGNLSGMGAVRSPIASSVPGQSTVKPRKIKKKN